MSDIDVYTVRENLANIYGLTQALADHTTEAANNGKLAACAPIPGGDAMTYLAPVSNYEAHMNMRMSEIMGRKPDWTHFDDEGDSWHPLLILAKWDAEWREQLGHPTDLRPTLRRTYDYLNLHMSHMSEHSETFDEFAANLATVKYLLEETLYAGVRHERGVPCIRCDHKVDLIRYSNDPSDNPDDQGGLRDEWVCPSCKNRYDRDSYYRAVHHAHVAHADYLPLTEAVARTGETGNNIKVWASRGHVAKRKDHNSGRMTYRIADIETRRAQSVA